jgi:choline dehydrogenase-like flavoprotein
MIVQPQDLHGDLTETADVCVIGSGAGGAVFADEMSLAGHSVVVLEEGPHYTSADFTQRSDEMMAKLYGERGWAATEDLSVNLLFAKCVGGSTVVHWADSFRTPPDRLDDWTREFRLRGKSVEELNPHFEKVERAINVAPATPDLFNNNNWLLKKGAEALGWQGEVVTQARKGCIGCGFAMEGCAYDSKQSMLVTRIPKMSDRGVKVFASCRAEHLLVEPDGSGRKAAGVTARFIDPQTGARGHELRVKSKLVALAAGGVGSPVFLLRNGVANSSGEVGRNFYTNPGSMVFALFDEEVLMYRKIPAAYGIHQFRQVRETRAREYVEGGYLILPNQLQPAVAAACLPGVGDLHRRYMQNFERVGGTYAIFDDENPGQIFLDGDKDPIFRYTLRGRDKAKTRDFLKKSALLMLAAGAREVLVPSHPPMLIRGRNEVSQIDSLALKPGEIILAAPHMLGTCRRGEDRSRSVVDSYGESHDIRNLWIVDGSSLPGSVSVDPSITIMAFASQSAEVAASRL